MHKKLSILFFFRTSHLDSIWRYMYTQSMKLKQSSWRHHACFWESTPPHRECIPPDSDRWQRLSGPPASGCLRQRPLPWRRHFWRRLEDRHGDYRVPLLWRIPAPQVLCSGGGSYTEGAACNVQFKWSR